MFLTKIGELLEKMNDRRGFQSRIHGIDRDADQFAQDVAALATRVAPDLDGREAAEAARELAVRLRAARDEAQEAATRVQQKQREEGTPPARPRRSARRRRSAWNGSARRRVAPDSTSSPRPSAARRTSPGSKPTWAPARSNC